MLILPLPDTVVAEGDSRVAASSLQPAGCQCINWQLLTRNCTARVCLSMALLHLKQRPTKGATELHTF